MFISKKNRLAVYAYLFKEGTLVAKKDPYLAVHPEIPIPNLEVLALMKSFASKKFVKETFNWQYYYYYLTAEGVNYLRSYLALPEDIIPATHKETAQKQPALSISKERPERKNVGPGEGFRPSYGGRGGRGGDRDGYRGGRGARE